MENARDSECRVFRRELGESSEISPGAEGPDHSRACPECRRWLEEMQALHRAMRSLAPAQLPDGFRAELVRRLEGAASGRPRTTSRRERGSRPGPARPARRPVSRAWRRVALAGGAAALAAALTVVVTTKREPPVALSPHHAVVLTLEAAGVARARDVEIEIELPDGISLAVRDPDLAVAKVLHWRQRLGPEGLRCRIGLIAYRVGTWRVRARAGDGGEWTTVTMPVSVSATSVAVGGTVLSSSPTPAHSALASLTLRAEAQPRPGDRDRETQRRKS